MQAAQDGFVSRAFAEEMWAKREAEFAKELEQRLNLVQGLLGSKPAQNQSQAASEVAPSDVADLDSLDDFADDDNAWGKVDKSKRKAVIKQAKLVREIKTGIGSWSKVSAAASPFAKQK